MGQEIGTGTFGKVLRGKCRGKDVAIKVLHKPIDDEKTLIAFKKEVEIMRYVIHTVLRRQRRWRWSKTSVSSGLPAAARHQPEEPFYHVIREF